jgi:hypothetical protein
VPRKVTVGLNIHSDKEFLITTLRKLGYSLIDDEISKI